MENRTTNSRQATPSVAARLPRFLADQHLLSQGFFSSLKEFLLERPVKLPQNAAGGVFTDPGFGTGFLENLKECWRPLPASARQAHSRMAVEWKPWYRLFWENLRDAMAPPKLPPLKVTSAPVKVRDIWSKDELFPRAQALSLSVHVLLALVVSVPLVYRVSKATQVPTVQADVKVIDISPYVAQLPPGKDKAGGGGGGGERNPTPPTKGKLPKFSMTQLTPPMAVIRNLNPKLPAEPTVIVPPEIRVPNPATPNYGDPLAGVLTNSGGPGGGGGIGTSCCGGVGSGEGPGVGPGYGGGIGGGAFHAGPNGVSYAECLYCPLPEYSEEARKAKYSGTVWLSAVVSPEGRAINISVIKSAGYGLDQKAIAAVRTWKFKPSYGPNGKPIPAVNEIEVTFRLL